MWLHTRILLENSFNGATAAAAGHLQTRKNGPNGKATNQGSQVIWYARGRRIRTCVLVLTLLGSGLVVGYVELTAGRRERGGGSLCDRGRAECRNQIYT